MDDIERRLTEALHAEADSVTPRGPSWNGHRSTARRGSATWLAVAAAVAVLVVGVTFALRAGRTSEATGPSVLGTSDVATTPVRSPADPHVCDGGWTSFGTPVIPGPIEKVFSATAILRMVGTSGSSTLCALVTGSDNTTLANGAALSDGSNLGYLTVISGKQTFLVGAFGSGVSSMTFTNPQIAGKTGANWAVTITASTAGITDLGDGWHGYAILSPGRKADVDVTASGSDGRQIASRHLSFAGGELPATRSSSSRSALSRETSSGIASVSRTSGSTGDGSSSMDCGGQLAAPLPGIKATIVPEAGGGWRFRLTNATKLPLTVETLHGYAQLIASDQGVVQSLSSDTSFVLRKAITLKTGESTEFATVGVSTSLCGGGQVQTGDHTMHLVLRGQLAGQSVVFTAASFVVHFPTSGPPVLVS